MMIFVDKYLLTKICIYARIKTIENYLNIFYENRKNTIVGCRPQNVGL